MSKMTEVPKIPIQASTNGIVVEMCKVESLIEQNLKKKTPSLIIDKEQLRSLEKQRMEQTQDITQIYSEHPMQAVIVAIGSSIVDNGHYKVGDRVALRLTEELGFLMVFDKKKYRVVFEHDIIFKYLTAKR